MALPFSNSSPRTSERTVLVPPISLDSRLAKPSGVHQVEWSRFPVPLGVMSVGLAAETSLL